MSDVIRLVHVTVDGDSADDILTSALGECDVVAVIGYRPNGELYCTSTECVAETLLLIERAKLAIIE